MKPNRLLNWLLVLPLLYGTSCTPCATLRSEPPAPVAFYLVDATGKSAFTNPAQGLHPDSIQLSLEGEPFTYLFTGTDEKVNNLIFETYPVIYTKSRVRMLLHLNSHSTDTLDIAYTVNRGKCYTDYTYGAFYFNGKELKRQPDTGYLQLQVL